MIEILEQIVWGLLIYFGIRMTIRLLFWFAEAYRVAVNEMEKAGELDDIDPEDPIHNAVPVDIEMYNDQLFAYHRETKAFLGQGKDYVELMKRLQELHPFKFISIKDDDVDKLNADVTKLIQQSLKG